MKDNLRIQRFNSYAIELAAAKNNIERYAGSRDSIEIYKEGVKSVSTQRVHAAKARNGMDLLIELYLHAEKTADEFSRETFARIEANSGNDDCDAYFQKIIHGEDGLLERFDRHLNGLLEVVATNIGIEVHKPVIVQKEEKRGWFR